MFMVVTRMSFNPSEKTKILEFTKKTTPLMKKQKGLISLKTLLSHDNTHMLSLLEWESKEDHEVCMVSDDWRDTNPQWEELLSSGVIKFELNSYDLLS